MFAAFFIFLMEVFTVQLGFNYIAQAYQWPELTYSLALAITLVAQTLTGTFKHQFYSWTATKSESLMISLMAKNPEALKAFLQAVKARVEAEKLNETESN